MRVPMKVLTAIALAFVVGLGTPPAVSAKAKGWEPRKGGFFNTPRAASYGDRVRIENQIYQAIQHAKPKSKIRFSIYSLDRMRMADALIRAAQAQGQRAGPAQRPPGVARHAQAPRSRRQEAQEAQLRAHLQAQLPQHRRQAAHQVLPVLPDRPSPQRGDDGFPQPDRQRHPQPVERPLRDQQQGAALRRAVRGLPADAGRHRHVPPVPLPGDRQELRDPRHALPPADGCP